MNENRQTILRVKNISDTSIITWLTLCNEESMVDNVNGIFGIKSDFDLQGNFVLHKGDEVEYQSPIGFGISGNICFGSQPVNCPTKQFINGVNIFEFTLNNYFNAQIKKIVDAQETVDISCVAGVNSLMKVNLLTDNKWNASSKYEDVKYFSNSTIHDNCNRVGVYPFGCDCCTSIKNPPSCDNVNIKYDKPQLFPICNVQRDCKNHGGVVELSFLGLIK